MRQLTKIAESGPYEFSKDFALKRVRKANHPWEADAKAKAKAKSLKLVW